MKVLLMLSFPNLSLTLSHNLKGLALKQTYEVTKKLEFHSNGNDWGKVFFHNSYLKVLYAFTQGLLAHPTQI